MTLDWDQFYLFIIVILIVHICIRDLFFKELDEIFVHEKNQTTTTQTNKNKTPTF